MNRALPENVLSQAVWLFQCLVTFPIPGNWPFKGFCNSRNLTPQLTNQRAVKSLMSGGVKLTFKTIFSGHLVSNVFVVWS